MINSRYFSLLQKVRLFPLCSSLISPRFRFFSFSMHVSCGKSFDVGFFQWYSFARVYSLRAAPRPVRSRHLSLFFYLCWRWRIILRLTLCWSRDETLFFAPGDFFFPICDQCSPCPSFAPWTARGDIAESLFPPFSSSGLTAFFWRCGIFCSVSLNLVGVFFGARMNPFFASLPSCSARSSSFADPMYLCGV